MCATDAAPPLLASSFDFSLPERLIAQLPARPRDTARLLCVDRGLADRRVADLPSLLRPGDLLVANDTRVIPARIAMRRVDRGGAARIGVTLDRPLADGDWHALARNTRRLQPGATLQAERGDLSASVLRIEQDGGVVLRFAEQGAAFAAGLRQRGALARPADLARPDGPSAVDAADYQTVFARHEGAVAAPTAGLHFTPALLDALTRHGVGRTTVTLHVGAGTFLPMRGDRVDEHRIHAERGVVTAAAAAAIAQARADGGRIVAVGTTTLRLLETAVDAAGVARPFDGETDLFLLPGHDFRAADLLMTNFHLPRSTLFMLVCAFAGEARMRSAYAHAIGSGYRFYSYGDASLLARASLLTHA